MTDNNCRVFHITRRKIHLSLKGKANLSSTMDVLKKDFEKKEDG